MLLMRRGGDVGDGDGRYVHYVSAGTLMHMYAWNAKRLAKVQ